jgi:hypothetical protein
MKNIIKWFGAIAPITAIVFSMAACASLTVVGIDDGATTGPSQVRQYGSINANDVTVYAYYKDDSRKEVTFKTIADFDSARPGPQTVTVKLSGGFTASFQTEVIELSAITVTSPPKTLKLGVPDRAWPGLEVQGDWGEMGSQKINISECTFTGFDTNRAGRQTVTVAWHGKQSSFNTDVVAMESMRITSLPSKVTYNQGEPLALAGMKVIGTWPGIGEDEVSITTANITGYNAQNKGRQILTVTMYGKTATFNVEVLENPAAALNGTWVSVETYSWGTDTNILRFNNGDVEMMQNGATFFQGTYTAGNGKLIITRTRVRFASPGSTPRLHTKAEMTIAARDAGFTQEQINLLHGSFEPDPWDYSLSGNTLSITNPRVAAQIPDYKPEIYTKR